MIAKLLRAGLEAVRESEGRVVGGMTRFEGARGGLM